MQTQKRYTNQTFTKRVDHEAGRHHTKRALPEPAVCEGCSDVYANRRWSKPNAIRSNKTSAEIRLAHSVVCPACQRQRDGVPGGFVYLKGAFITAHQDEITKLLQNEAERAAEDNPLARIMEWQTGPKAVLTVTTTTEHLAQRLGHALEKAYGGKVRYDFSHENKLARVWWQRT